MILALVLFSSVITAILTFVELYIDYRSDISDIKKRFEFIGKSYLPTLTDSVWIADDIQIQTQLDGLSRLQDIETLTISTDNTSRWSVGTAHSSRTLSADIPIIRQYRGKDIQIAVLHITGSIDNILNRLYTKLVVVLIRNGIKTLLVAGFMLLIFQFLVGRHLEHLALYLRTKGAKHDDGTELKFARKDTGHWRPDALDHVSNAINTMRKNVMKYNNDIIELNSTLEKRVEIRTAELEKVNAQLNTALQELEATSQAKSLFLSRMSHELRTPLNAICGFSQLLEIEPLTDDQGEYVDWIYKSGCHLLNLIDDLLDLSQIDAGKLLVDSEPVSISHALTNAVRMSEGQRNDKETGLINCCVKDYVVMADRTRLTQIIINLLSNAIKYGKKHGEIRIECLPVGDKHMRLLVSDNGPGIPADKHNMVFTPFERLGAEFTDVEGTGTGLALAKNLIELMGGRIGFSSTEGEGSTFWIELQLADGEISEDKMELHAGPQSANDHYKVLYIEDNPANLKLVESIFKRHSEFTLFSANNGADGLQLAKQQCPDIILLDIHLPGMDGYEILQRLRTSAGTTAIPVIAITADAMPAEVSRGLKAGFERYITKPFNPADLVNSIRTILSK